MNSANFVAETNPLPPYLPLHGYGIMVLCTAFVRVYIFTRYKTRGNYEREGIFENLELEGRGNEDDDRRANFLRGGKREKRREDGRWKFIVGQPMLMLRARGKIEIRLHFRKSWRVGGSTVRTEGERESHRVLVRGGERAPYILSVHEISRNRGCPAWQPLAASTAREITLRS